MAADLKGVLTTLSNALPLGIDGQRYAQWMLRDGVSYDVVRADVVAAMNAVNLEELSAFGDLIYVTPDVQFEYPTGGSIYKMPRLSDLDRPTPRKGKTTGHSVDLWKVGDAIGGTEDYFMDARRAVINSSISELLLAGRNTWEIDVLTRFFTNTENQLGSYGYDVGFCDGSTTVQYAPLQFNGKVFTTAHNHYVGYDSATKTLADVFDGLALLVTEHGHQPPLIAYVSESDTATIRALTNYIKPVDVEWDRGGLTSGNIYREPGQTLAPPAVGGRYMGGYDSNYARILLYASNRIPSGYVGVFKSYGTNDPRNPIAVRIHPNIGFGYYIAEIPSYVTTWPVKVIEVYNRYGVSANGMGAFPRTAGAAGYLSSAATWVNPTIA